LSGTAGRSSSGIPDRLTVFILDGSGTPIATLAPAGDFLIGIDLTSEDASPEVFGSDSSRPTFTGAPISIPRSTVDERKTKTEKNHKNTEVRYMAGTRLTAYFACPESSVFSIRTFAAGYAIRISRFTESRLVA
jgi:hypothetical protein